MAKRKPEDVFTPRTIVGREMFEKRNEPDLNGLPGVQDTLQEALLERGGQVLLYGDTGVGKSSLIKHAAEDENLGHVLVECEASMDYDSILEFAIRELVDVREMKRSRRKSAAVEGSVESNVMPWIAKVTGRIRGEVAGDREFEVLEQSALGVLTQAMEQSKKTLIVLDNFQNIPADARERVSQGMEILSDRAGRDYNAPDFKFVVIGIASDAETLLGTSRSYGRRTTEIGVPRMPDDEISEIFRRGFELLGLQIAPTNLDKLVFYSDGFPYFAHLLGLNTSRAANRSGSSNIDERTIDIALKRSVQSVAASYRDRVRKASEVGGGTQPRKNIIAMLALSSKRSWYGTEIVELWETTRGKVEKPAFLHVAMSQLTKDEYGQVLRRSGPQRKYVYEFSDPHLRPFLRISGV